MSEPTKFEQWAVVELMGHVRMAGKVSEEVHFGAAMGRIDIPSREECRQCSGMATEFLQANKCAACQGNSFTETWSTQYFGGSSIYRITPVAEDVARAVAQSSPSAPISPYQLPKRITAAWRDEETDDDDDPR